MSEQGFTRAVLCTELIQSLIKDNQEGFVLDFTAEDHNVKIGKNVAIWLQGVAAELTQRSEKIRQNNAAQAAIEFALQFKYEEDMAAFIEQWHLRNFAHIRDQWPNCPSACFEGME